MSLLTVIIATASILFVIIWWDAYKRGRINLLHGSIFILWSLVIWYSIYKPWFLDQLWKIFWLARWADIVVYGAILFLVYLFFDTNNKLMKQEFIMTKLVTNEALSHVDSEYIKNQTSKQTWFTTSSLWTINKSDFMFHIKGLNESKTIGKVIDDIIWAGFSKILVVNDGSTDSMSDIVQSKQQQYPDSLIVLVNHLINRRHWGWNKTGIAFFRKYGVLCNIKYVVFFDSDDQMDIADMKTYMEHLILHPETDVIQWSRFIEWWTTHNMPLLRKIILRWAKLITYLFNGIAITDSHNGYKCFRLDALCKINLTSDTTLYANELVDEYKRLWLHVIELPVHIKYSEYSLWKGQKNSNAINILVEMIYRKLFYR